MRSFRSRRARVVWSSRSRSRARRRDYLVDTGGIVSSIAAPVADALHLKTRRITSGVEVYAADGGLLNRYADVKKFGIGPIIVGNVKLLLQPDETKTGANAFGGTLAPDMLRNFDVDFDFGGGTLSFFSPDHCKGQVVYWATHYGTVPFITDGSHMLAMVTLDGHAFRAFIDTGASLTTISAKVARSYFGLTPGSAGLEPIPGTSDGDLVRFRHRFATLTIGDVTVNNPMIAILPDDMEKSVRRHHDYKQDRDPIYGIEIKAPEIVLGLDVLSRLHMYVAYGEKTLYVTAAGAGHAAAAK